MASFFRGNDQRTAGTITTQQTKPWETRVTATRRDPISGRVLETTTTTRSTVNVDQRSGRTGGWKPKKKKKKGFFAKVFGSDTKKPPPPPPPKSNKPSWASGKPSKVSKGKAKWTKPKATKAPAHAFHHGTNRRAGPPPVVRRSWRKHSTSGGGGGGGAGKLDGASWQRGRQEYTTLADGGLAESDARAMAGAHRDELRQLGLGGSLEGGRGNVASAGVYTARGTAPVMGRGRNAPAPVNRSGGASWQRAAKKPGRLSGRYAGTGGGGGGGGGRRRPPPKAGASAQSANGVALFGFSADGPGEVDVREGDAVTIYKNAKEESEGWAEIKNHRTGKRGVVPKDYVGPAAQGGGGGGGGRRGGGGGRRDIQGGGWNKPSRSSPEPSHDGLTGHHGVLRKMPWE